MTLQTFIDETIDSILAREGGFVDHKADRGGPTKFGITQETLSKYVKRDVTREEVRNLDVAVARDIYTSEYIRKPGFDLLPEAIAEYIIDVGVNSGPGTAAKMLQRVINRCGFGPIDVDGRAGPITREAATTAIEKMSDLFMAALIVERIAFYNLLIAGDPNQMVFKRGWMNRQKKFWPRSLNDQIDEVF